MLETTATQTMEAAVEVEGVATVENEAEHSTLSLSVMIALGHGMTSIAEISDELDVSPPEVYNTLSAGLSHGWFRFEQNEGEQRRWYLTDLGRGIAGIAEEPAPIERPVEEVGLDNLVKLRFEVDREPIKEPAPELAAETRAKTSAPKSSIKGSLRDEHLREILLGDRCEIAIAFAGSVFDLSPRDFEFVGRLNQLISEFEASRRAEA
ncbi:MAG: hypothetical protein ACK4S4_15505 [Pyrinomonadaceae bacterium]